MTEKIWLKVKHFNIRNMKNLWNFPAHIFLVSLNTFSVFFHSREEEEEEYEYPILGEL